MIANLSQRDIFKVKKAADLLAEAKRKRNLLRGPVSEDEVIAALGGIRQFSCFPIAWSSGLNHHPKLPVRFRGTSPVLREVHKNIR